MKRPTILLFHGWIRAASAATYYAKTIEAFEKKGYTVIVPDMPGFGTADVPQTPMTLQQYAEFVDRYLQKRKIQPDFLIGHSFGGRVILEYIASFSFQGKAVVLSGTPGYPSANKLKMAGSLIIAKLGAVFFSLPFLSKFSDKIRGWFYYCIGARDFYRANGVMRQTFKNIVIEPLKLQMSKLRVPTLLVWGEDDVIVPVRIARQMQQTIPHAKLTVLPSYGHNVVSDAAALFADEVIRFIKTI